MSAIAGKNVIITGASKGIGAASARHLAELGANVVLAARSEGEILSLAREIVADCGAAAAIRCDVSRFSDVASVFDQAATAFGEVDILVNNAGLIEPISHIADSDPEAWGHVVDVNYKGVYYGMRCAIPRMLKQGGGTIINISSGAAVSALEGWSHYCSTKAAVLSLTRCADREYRELGIRVVGLSPGTVATEMQDAIRKSGVNPVSQLDWSTHIPPEWVAKAIAYLTTPESDDMLGTDFSLKTDEGRARIGLPPVSKL